VFDSITFIGLIANGRELGGIDQDVISRKITDGRIDRVASQQNSGIDQVVAANNLLKFASDFFQCGICTQMCVQSNFRTRSRAGELAQRSPQGSNNDDGDDSSND
jgi:heterodisulfide reductase subunit C